MQWQMNNNSAILQKTTDCTADLPLSTFETPRTRGREQRFHSASWMTGWLSYIPAASANCWFPASCLAGLKSRSDHSLSNAINRRNDANALSNVHFTWQAVYIVLLSRIYNYCIEWIIENKKTVALCYFGLYLYFNCQVSQQAILLQNKTSLYL